LTFELEMKSELGVMDGETGEDEAGIGTRPKSTAPRNAKNRKLHGLVRDLV